MDNEIATVTTEKNLQHIARRANESNAVGGEGTNESAAMAEPAGGYGSVSEADNDPLPGTAVAAASSFAEENVVT